MLKIRIKKEQLKQFTAAVLLLRDVDQKELLHIRVAVNEWDFAADLKFAYCLSTGEKLTKGLDVNWNDVNASDAGIRNNSVDAYTFVDMIKEAPETFEMTFLQNGISIENEYGDTTVLDFEN